jgi:hypothetical protein
MKNERRQNFRIEWKSPASIDLGEGTERLNCVVKNLSNGGARIACHEELPDQFILRLTPGRGRPRSCRVAWRRGEEVGVQFVDILPPDGPSVRTRVAEVVR